MTSSPGNTQNTHRRKGGRSTGHAGRYGPYADTNAASADDGGTCCASTTGTGDTTDDFPAASADGTSGRYAGNGAAAESNAAN